MPFSGRLPSVSAVPQNARLELWQLQAELVALCNGIASVYNVQTGVQKTFKVDLQIIIFTVEITWFCKTA